MILLLGGTGESRELAERLAQAGHKVLVSTATEISLELGSHAHIQKRAGPLHEKDLRSLIRERGIQAVVDATHPYAAEISMLARRVAEETDLPYFLFLRPGSAAQGENIFRVTNHAAAAALACSFARPVLLTIGSKNLEPYLYEAGRAGVRVAARVLPESVQACRAAGVPEEFIVTGRGPFSVEENQGVIRRLQIGVLVTKDSGSAGGVPAKLEAARRENCLVVLVERPSQDSPGAFTRLDDLVKAVMKKISKHKFLNPKQIPMSKNPK